MSMEDTMNEMLAEIKKTNELIEQMSKEIKDMKSFTQVLSNKMSKVL